MKIHAMGVRWILVFCLCGWVIPVHAERQDVVVILNKNAPERYLSRERIEYIYTGKTTMWNSSDEIVLCTLRDEKIHMEFLKEFIKRSPAQFKNTWRQMVFTGKGKLQRDFDTDEEMKQFVASNPNTICYITQNMADSDITAILPDEN